MCGLPHYPPTTLKLEGIDGCQIKARKDSHHFRPIVIFYLEPLSGGRHDGQPGICLDIPLKISFSNLYYFTPKANQWLVGIDDMKQMVINNT